jgi:hypothetical protein
MAPEGIQIGQQIGGFAVEGSASELEADGVVRLETEILCDRASPGKTLPPPQPKGFGIRLQIEEREAVGFATEQGGQESFFFGHPNSATPIMEGLMFAYLWRLGRQSELLAARSGRSSRAANAEW